MATDDFQRKKNLARIGSAVGLTVVLGVLVIGPQHLLRLASSAEYRRCWTLAQDDIPPGFDVFSIEVSEQEIRWRSSKWSGDIYEYSTSICRRGSARIEGSVLD